MVVYIMYINYMLSLAGTIPGKPQQFVCDWVCCSENMEHNSMYFDTVFAWLLQYLKALWQLKQGLC